MIKKQNQTSSFILLIK